MVDDVGELRKIAGAYSKAKTFTFIEELINGRINYYNGYIRKVYTDMILFYDEFSGKEFPILLETIKIIRPSLKKGGKDG